MTNPVEKTAITDAASQDDDLGNARLEWSQPILVRNDIERATRGGSDLFTLELGGLYRPS